MAWQDDRNEDIERQYSTAPALPAHTTEKPEVVDDDYPEPEMPAGLAKVSHDA